MVDGEDLLHDQAAATVARSQTLRADRAALDRARRHALAEQQQLRDATNVLSHNCQERREALRFAMGRWAYMARFFPIAGAVPMPTYPAPISRRAEC